MRKFLTSLLFFASVSAFSQEKLVVYFDFDSHGLTTEARQQLSEFSMANASSKISLFGHCDSRGTNAYNDALALRRVNSVRAFLVSKGIPETHIIESRGFGEEQPLNQNKTEEDRRLNRRVEIVYTRAEIPQEPIAPPEKQEPIEGETPVTLQQRIHDTLLQEGANLVLQNLNFYGGMARIVPASYPMLEELLNVMQTTPGLEIEIQGHICCQPGDGDGVNSETGERSLSLDRAKAIHDYLVKNGIDKKRLSYKGFGHSQPIYPYPERNPEEAEANRRVEIKILRK